MKLSGITLIFIITLMSSCQSTSEFSKEHKENPCQDPAYLKLRKMKVNEMTGSEYEYFKKKEKACQEFTEEINIDKSKSDFVIALIIIGAAVVVAAPLLIFKSH